MPENFQDSIMIKDKRGDGLTSKAREVTEAGPPPVAVQEVKPEPVVEVTEPQEEAPARDKTVINKGFIVGTTEGGKVAFKVFGGTDKLELIGLVDYAEAIKGDLLSELAETRTNDIPAIKSGLEATLKGMSVLLGGLKKEE
jgi:hypothetical protein